MEPTNYKTRVSFSIISYHCRIFPWGCTSGFLKRIVPDAAPQHGLYNGIPHIKKAPASDEKTDNGDIKTTTLSDNSNNNNNNNNNTSKAASMLIKRLPSIGERVL